jgi:hypothetical protein
MFIWRICLFLGSFATHNQTYWEPILIKVSSMLNSSIFFSWSKFSLIYIFESISIWLYEFCKQTFVMLLQYFYTMDQENRDIKNKQCILTWFSVFVVPLYVITYFQV